MLEVIYNDSYSQLTILDNLNDEGFMVVDDELNTYKTLSYGCFEPTKDDLIYLFKTSLRAYYDLDNQEKHIITSDYRRYMFEKSLKAFCEWLETRKELWGGEK